MRNILIIALLVFAALFSGKLIYSQNNPGEKTQQNNPEEEQKVDTAKVGIYLFSIYDVDFPGDKISADFYIWYLYKDDSLKLNETFDLVNAKEAVKSGEAVEYKAGYKYVTFRCNAVIKKQWDITDFPFDRQYVELQIEDAEFDKSKLVLIADSMESKIDKETSLQGFKIRDFGIKNEDHTYETTYGDPTLKPNDYSTYSRVVVYFTIDREGKGIFFKLFIGLFISVLISFLTFFINPTDLDPRFGLSVGAIFAAIANQYVISSTLPQNQKLTLVDILHVIAYIFIFICILVSAISLHYMKKGNAEKSKKIDRYSFIMFSALYVILTLYFVTRSLG